MVAGGEAKRKARRGGGDGGGGESEEEDGEGELPAAALGKRQRHQPIVWRAAHPPGNAAPAVQELQPGLVRPVAPSEACGSIAAQSQQLSELRTQALISTTAVPIRGSTLHLAASSGAASPNGRASDSAARLRSSLPGTPGRGSSPQPAAPSSPPSGLAAEAGGPVNGRQSATAIAAAECAAFQAVQSGGGDIDQDASAAMRSSPSGSKGAAAHP